MSTRSLVLAAVALTLVAACPPPALASEGGPSAENPVQILAEDAFALASTVTSAVPVHNQCTGIPGCRYLETECTNPETDLGAPCGKNAGETPDGAPPHTSTQCKCNWCSGGYGFICALGHY